MQLHFNVCNAKGIPLRNLSAIFQKSSAPSQTSLKRSIDAGELPKDQDTIFYMRRPWANWVMSEASQVVEGDLGVLPWKNLGPRSGDLLKTALILFLNTDRLYM